MRGIVSLVYSKMETKGLNLVSCLEHNSYSKMILRALSWIPHKPL